MLWTKIKIWLWWNMAIKQNEFHHSLDFLGIYLSASNVKSANESVNVVIARRELAHNLDNGDSVAAVIAAMPSSVKRAEINVRDIVSPIRKELLKASLNMIRKRLPWK